MDTERFDSDQFADWLYGEVFGKQPVTLTYVPNNRVTLACEAEGYTAQELLALAVYPADHAAGVAMQELMKRYEKYLDVRAEVQARGNWPFPDPETIANEIALAPAPAPVFREAML